uniref:Uncharacterized protein n=1 Tax=Panagrolaimus sp. PS1159 TaxID=55785 RepID=A0AC35FC47_9BILA
MLINTYRRPRAASFPLAHAEPLANTIKVRSQSEAAGLNNIKVSRLSSNEMQLENGVRVHSAFFSHPQLTHHHHSNSNGKKSIISSDSGNTSEDDHDNELQFPSCTCSPCSKKKVRFADDCGEALE